MSREKTVFQRLQQVLTGASVSPSLSTNNTYNIHSDNNVIDTATSKSDYQMKLLQAKQQKLLGRQWVKAHYDITNQSLSGLNELKLSYRDSDLMDAFPEIGAALDAYSEESCTANDKGFIVNVFSNSERIKSILQDLFTNRLNINIILPMICRSMCKYGNTFMLLNVDQSKGVLGWKQLPVYEIERYENGMDCPYASSTVGYNLNNVNEKNIDKTKFVWVGQSEYIPYREFQIAHFRLLYDSQFLPYGVSILNKARRHFRMLSMMEDMMLVYRLDRSVERRVFKINVGAIDEADVPAYVQQIADNFKRTPIIDPMTGQIDLRKNVMNNLEDFFIPVRDDSAPNPIETLSAGQNLTAMDDIKYIQNKVLTALRIPKSFLNFDDAQGDGKNLSLLDVRFTRTVNRVQQALIMELNKIAIIHLCLLGFFDELNNFTLTMNNPSSQAEMLEIENVAKRITTAKDAVSDPGGGIPLTSMTWAWKNIMKWSDKEIQRNLEEIRLETALAAELQKTTQIIKKTGLFDPVDNIYGEPGAEYQDAPDANGEEGGAATGGGGGGMPIGMGDMSFGDDIPDDGMETGEEGEMSMEDTANEDNSVPNEGGGEANDQSDAGTMPNLGEMILHGMKSKIEEKKKVINRNALKRAENYSHFLINRLVEVASTHKEKKNNDINDIYLKNLSLNEELEEISKDLKNFDDKGKK